MTVVRRVYVYLLAFAGLVMLAGGAANLGRVLVEAATGTLPASADYVREEVSRWGAAALLGLPVWLIHWWWAQRLAAGSGRGVSAAPPTELSADDQSSDAIGARMADGRGPAVAPGRPTAALGHVLERASTLRRLYVYTVLAVGVLAGATAAHEAIEQVLEARWALATEQLPLLLVASVVWLFHGRVAADDRAAVGEQGGSATLRRWYIYGAALIGLGLLLSGARQLVEALWLVVLASAPSGQALDGVPDALVGLALAVLHGPILGRQFARDDEQSVLRSVALFGSLAVAVGGTVLGLSQILYYALGRALGVERPGGVGGSLVEAAAGPVSVVLVFGVAWLSLRVAVREQAKVQEAPRQIGVRRLYRYLVALVAVTVLAVGVAGLLWVLADALTSAPGTSTIDWWRDRVAQFATLTVVGLPVWIVYWRPGVAVDADEAGSLSRRLYAYLVLIGAGLALLYSAADAAYRVLTLVLGASPSASLLSNLAHDLAIASVAGLLVAQHALTVRADARMSASAAAATHAVESEAVEAVWRVRAADASRLQQAVTDLKRKGVEVEVVS